jgi:ribosomal-protein-alanine N-acetyltransferase
MVFSLLSFDSSSIASRYNGPVPFAIRDYASSDFDALWRIDQDCFPPGIAYSRGELSFYMRRSTSFTLVAVETPPTLNNTSPLPSKPPEAYAGFIVAEAGRRSGHIITIDVVAAARRSGVGSLLLREAEERLRAARCVSVELETAVDNTSALSFYKRHGYSVIKTSPRYYSNGVDALVLEKALA